jgi:crotonobetainyl-CoA:carnitine CoA-transferase CaiB-like acyl-CoA transferase
MNNKPLEGIRVLDLTRVVSGPFATMQLADLGAEVMKIEEPQNGDDSRAFGPPFIGGESAYFLSVNRNKRSCAVDLKSTEGRALIMEIASRSDVLIENFRPGTLERLGLGYELLKAQNPRLIYCSITGFGTSGPDAQRPGYDLILQGEAGFMDITGDPNGPPTKVGTSVGDMIAGLYAAQGVLAALIERDKTQTGCAVHISMLDSLASLLTFNAGIYFATGESPTRRGNEHPTISPYETFRASDGWLNLGVANDKFWTLFCQCIAPTSLETDSRFSSAPDRVRNRSELRPLIAEMIGSDTREAWVTKLNKAGVPCGPIRTIKEVCETEQLVSRGMIRSIQHPTAGTIRNIASPVRLNDKIASDDFAPPLLGQHTAEILRELLGLTEEQVKDLEDRKIVRSIEIKLDRG